VFRHKLVLASAVLVALGDQPRLGVGHVVEVPMIVVEQSGWRISQ